MIRWLPVAISLFTAWLALVLRPPLDIDSTLRNHVMLIPVYLLIVFVLVSTCVVLYRVVTFNDCKDAYYELQDEIKEARKNLEKKGFKFY